MNRLALIDADSIVYILAWKHRDDPEAFGLEHSIDSFIESILVSTNADCVIGAFTADTHFRYPIYKYADYKGHRGEKPIWVSDIELRAMHYMMDNYKFIKPNYIEADDVLSYIPQILPKDTYEFVYCSPDKDLKQLAGVHYDYRTLTTVVISEQEAMYNLAYQLLIGDVTDNIKGIPGIGKVKAAKILKDYTHHLSGVFQEYIKAFGEYYGNIIYEQTFLAVSLLTPELVPIIQTNLTSEANAMLLKDIEVLNRLEPFKNPFTNYEQLE